VKPLRLFTLLACTALVTAGCNIRVNKSLYVSDGETVRGGRTTVNGSIIIGSDAEVKGDCRSVNGSIEVGRSSKVRDLQSVNGSIRIKDAAVVRGDVESVNGSVTCYPGVEINGNIATVNGAVELENTRVRRDITTYNGEILLLDKSSVHGDIIVKKNRGKSHRRRPLTIEITENSVVEGGIIVKDGDIDVIVYLSRGGKVKGRIRNAEVIKR